jgi:hypothetical protein
VSLTNDGSIAAVSQSYCQALGVAFSQSGHDMREGFHLEVYSSALNPNSDEYEMGSLFPLSRVARCSGN